MRPSTIVSLSLFASLVAAALPAAALDAVAPPASATRTVAGEIGPGVGFGIPFGGMAVGPSLFLEGGVRILAGPGSLAIALRGSFQSFSMDGSGKAACTTAGKPCIQSSGGSYSYHLTEQAVLLGLPITYRFLPPKALIAPYIGIMPELFMMKSRMTAYDQLNTQGDLRFGVAGMAGAQLHVGPGGIFLDLAIQYAGLNPKDPTSNLSVTGPSNMGAFTMAVGYRFAI